ncbi:MAG: HEPN domain-containing protein [Gillisia sp.]
METKARGLFKEAFQKLEAANEELCRPEEDVVSYLVCRHSQIAIENFLKGYLLKNNIEPKENETVSSLYNKCLELNHKFREIDLTNFTCKSYKPDSRSCSSIPKVNGCFEVAGSLNSFLEKEKTFS